MKSWVVVSCFVFAILLSSSAMAVTLTQVGDLSTRIVDFNINFTQAPQGVYVLFPSVARDLDRFDVSIPDATLYISPRYDSRSYRAEIRNDECAGRSQRITLDDGSQLEVWPRIKEKVFTGTSALRHSDVELGSAELGEGFCVRQELRIRFYGQVTSRDGRTGIVDPNHPDNQKQGRSARWVSTAAPVPVPPVAVNTAYPNSFYCEDSDGGSMLGTSGTLNVYRGTTIAAQGGSDECLRNSDFPRADGRGNLLIEKFCRGNRVEYIVVSNDQRVLDAHRMSYPNQLGVTYHLMDDRFMYGYCENGRWVSPIAPAPGPGGGAPRCGDADDVCSQGLFGTGEGHVQRVCTTMEGYPGTQRCNDQCSGYLTCRTRQNCGDGICTGLESQWNCPIDCRGAPVVDVSPTNAGLLNLSLQALYGFDLFDNTGSYARDAVSSRQAAIRGPLYTADGALRSALTFDGVDDYVEVPESDRFVSPGFFSIGIWVKTTSSNVQIVWEKNDANGGSIATVKTNGVYLNAQGIPSFFGKCTDNSQGAGVTATSSVNDGRWHHIMAVRENIGPGSIVRKIYVDGVLQGTSPDTECSDFRTREPLYIGIRSESGWSYPFNGAMDDFVAYNRVLSEDQIRELARR